MNKDNKLIYEAYGDDERKARVAMDNDIRTGDADDRSERRFQQDMDREIEADDQISIRCRQLFEREFAVEKTVRQIVTTLTS